MNQFITTTKTITRKLDKPYRKTNNNGKATGNFVCTDGLGNVVKKGAKNGK